MVTPAPMTVAQQHRAVCFLPTPSRVVTETSARLAMYALAGLASVVERKVAMTETNAPMTPATRIPGVCSLQTPSLAVMATSVL